MAEWKHRDLEKKIGYTFHSPRLLIQAMRHSSYANERRLAPHRDNERLEFLGDAVLEVTSSDFLYHQYPDMPEGKLTKLRASIVCEPTLAQCAREFGLQQYLLLGHGEEHTGGRMRDSIISDALEALIGAIYLDGGLEAARAFVGRFILTDIGHKKLFYDSKTVLQEIVQRRENHEDVHYELLGEEGPDHAKIFRAEVVIDGEVAGTGSGSTKKAAEQEAAYRAILAIRAQNGEETPEQEEAAGGNSGRKQSRGSYVSEKY